MYNLKSIVEGFSRLSKEEREKWLRSASLEASTTYRFDEGMMVSDEEARRFHKELKTLGAVHEKLNLEETIRDQLITKLEKECKIDTKSNEDLQREYDVFISYANEDKKDFVNPLAKKLKRLGIKVWYDEIILEVGDSLRRSIDEGLAHSKYGIVVLSSYFFDKKWPQYELDGLIEKEMQGNKVILPIWHKITKDEVIKRCPSLANKTAINSSHYTIKEIAHKLKKVIKS